jgi:hypothetical protein
MGSKARKVEELEHSLEENVLGILSWEVLEVP